MLFLEEGGCLMFLAEGAASYFLKKKMGGFTFLEEGGLLDVS